MQWVSAISSLDLESMRSKVRRTPLYGKSSEERSKDDRVVSSTADFSTVGFLLARSQLRHHSRQGRPQKVPLWASEARPQQDHQFQ